MEMRFSIRESVLETDGGHNEVNLFLNVYVLLGLEVPVYERSKSMFPQNLYRGTYTCKVSTSTISTSMNFQMRSYFKNNITPLHSELEV